MNNRELPGMISGNFYIRRKLEDGESKTYRPCEGAYLGLSVLRQEKQGTGQGMHRMRQAPEYGDKI
jgi:hypothetical protein